MEHVCARRPVLFVLRLAGAYLSLERTALEAGHLLHHFRDSDGISDGNYREQAVRVGCLGLQRPAISVVRTDLRAIYCDLCGIMHMWDFSWRVPAAWHLPGRKTGVACLVEGYVSEITHLFLVLRKELFEYGASKVSEKEWLKQGAVVIDVEELINSK